MNGFGVGTKSALREITCKTAQMPGKLGTLLVDKLHARVNQSPAAYVSNEMKFNLQGHR